jgi:hypothetical protein
MHYHVVINRENISTGTISSYYRLDTVMNRPITLISLVSTLFFWKLCLGVEAGASPPKNAKRRTSFRHGLLRTLDQDIQNADQDRKMLSDLEKKFYLSKPDFSYSGLQFNLHYLVSDYVKETHLEVINGIMWPAYPTLAFTHFHFAHLYLFCSTKSMTDTTAPKVRKK